MRSAEERGLVIAKLEDGEDLFASLERIVREHGLRGGTVLWGIGMVREFELGYFDGAEYRRTVFPEPHELLALHGTLTPGSDPPLHVHLAAGDSAHRVVGGHVFRATVNVLNEVCIARLDSVRLRREVSPGSGLRELVVETPPAARTGTRGGRARSSPPRRTSGGRTRRLRGPRRRPGRRSTRRS